MRCVRCGGGVVGEEKMRCRVPAMCMGMMEATEEHGCVCVCEKRSHVPWKQVVSRWYGAD